MTAAQAGWYGRGAGAAPTVSTGEVLVAISPLRIAGRLYARNPGRAVTSSRRAVTATCCEALPLTLRLRRT